MKIWFVIFLCIFTVGCSGLAKQSPDDDGYHDDPSNLKTKNWNMLTGTWFGRQSLDDGGRYDWIMRKYPNGQYQLEGLIMSSNGETYEETEVGEWGVGTENTFTSLKGWIENGEFVKTNTFNG